MGYSFSRRLKRFIKLGKEMIVLAVIGQVINSDQIPLLGSGKTDYKKLDTLYLAQ